MLDQEDLDRLQEAESNPNKFVVRGVKDSNKLGAITVVCFILNRTIGSGIFVLPATVLKGTDSIGIALILWAFGGVVSIAALLVWLTLAKSIPRFEVDGQEVSVPRSGGEKNYVRTLVAFPLCAGSNQRYSSNTSTPHRNTS
jgi:O-antigen/teichoic acid export membrane protein